jgi:lipoprotein-anchoring transpeptidase ErfK/SrfK
MELTQKILIHSALGVAVFAVMFGVSGVLLGRLVSGPSTQTAAERTTVPFEETERFAQQVGHSSGEYVENAGQAVFDNEQLAVEAPRPKPTNPTQVLGVQTPADVAERKIEVDLSEQKLRAWDGPKLAYELPVSTGVARHPTVKGTFRVWRKVLSQSYRGGSRVLGNYYYLPNVPYSLFFYKGYAIHGAYWHNDFGIRRRSHGCVNLSIADARKVYEWAMPVMPVGVRALNATADNPGIVVSIHD